MQRYEIESWLGDALAELTAEQVDELMATAEEIGARYPDPDQHDERDAALTVAHRLLCEPAETVVDEHAEALVRARTAETRALAALRQAARSLVAPSDQGSRGVTTLMGYARRAGVDRQAVRQWIDTRGDT